MAAEINAARSFGSAHPRGFNEAAANGRGNLSRTAVRLDDVDVASMRPRRMAAEISRPTTAAPAAAGRFNEAAANGRGNRAVRVALPGRAPGRLQ